MCLVIITLTREKPWEESDKQYHEYRTSHH